LFDIANFSNQHHIKSRLLTSEVVDGFEAAFFAALIMCTLARSPVLGVLDARVERRQA
jgi:hypothetical protein